MSNDSDGVEDEAISPNETQEKIIESDEYPMRVLAGAGTGKTTTMVWKIEDLVASGVPPDEILALTFTNKAATAMQEKVAEQLDDPERAYDITATTYHAIAHQLLSEHVYYAGLDPEYDIADEVERSKLVYECLDEIPYQFTDPAVTEPDDTSFWSGVEKSLEAFISQFKSAKITPEDLNDYLPPAKPLGEVGDLVTLFREIADEKLYVHGNTTPNSLDSEQLADVKQGLNTLLTEAAACRRMLPETGGGRVLTDLIRDIETIFSELQAHIEPLDAEELTDKDLDYVRAPAYLLGQHGNPPGGLPEQDPRLIDRFEDLVRDWQQAFDLNEGYRAYEARLNDRGLLDYDDLIFNVLELFENESLGPRLRDRYQYVVCDEFQDTDKAQFRLVQELVGEDNLFLVGDDDQAIYEWRGANPSNIREDIKEAYPGLQTEELEHNYRSRPDILGLANAMVESIEMRSAAKKLDADRKPHPDTTIATLEDYNKDSEMQRIGSAMEQLISGTAPGVTHDIGYGDMAVLVRNNRHAFDLIPELEQRDIPYELAGDLASRSVGIETVIAYLKALADPEVEVPLSRVLLLRYRLPETDLDRLHQYDGTLINALDAVPDTDLTAPDRARTAHEHLTELLSRRETHSLSQLYAAIKRITNIEWFLTENERNELRYLDDVIEQYAEEPIATSLNSEFIEHLRHGVSALIKDESDGVEPSEDVVTILTVHKAKGLEFPVVFMPQLTEKTWGPSVKSYDRLRPKLDGKEIDPAVQQTQEQRRVFHVGVTRAEDLLVLSTSSGSRSNSTETTTDEFSLEGGDIYGSLPEESDLKESDAAFPVWAEVSAALPKGSTDWTDATDNAVDDSSSDDESDVQTGGEDKDDITRRIETTLTGEIDKASVTELELEAEALSESASPEALRKHSYTAIDRFETCKRWHYLTNVVYAFEDPFDGKEAEQVPSGVVGNTSGLSSGVDGEVSPVTIGNIFHETAERAAPDPKRTSVADWKELAEDVARKHGVDHIPDRVSNCITNYHESKLAEWDIVTTERPFELNLGKNSAEQRPLVVRGYIDAVYKQGGSYYIVDYKTSQAYSADHRRQAQIYMLACEELFDYNVSAAYIYYLNRGPDESVPLERIDGRKRLRDKVRDALAPLNNASYAEATAEKPSDCRNCPHNNLPCSRWPPEEAD
jgi:DNA helicase-2/ATP-dependent DNA helicase PcrA